MSDNNTLTPEEIARANERQKELNEKRETREALLEIQRIKELSQPKSHLMLKLLLLPATLLFCLNVLSWFVGIEAALTPGVDITLQSIFIYTAIVFVAGCGIGSIWWLVTHYEKLSFPDIPVRIWIGLGFGVIISVGCVRDFYKVKPLTEPGWFSLNETGTWIVYGTPVLILMILLIRIAIRK
jgi:hypothetical protein